MRIEKISSTQVKFFLNQTDLAERNINLSELASSSEKAQELFKEIMSQAVDTCGITLDNTPLMVEAVPLSEDNIVIIVSKVSDPDEIQSKLSLIPPTMVERKYITKPMSAEIRPVPIDDKSLSIYSFESLDIVSDACRVIQRHYDGASQLFKYDNAYYLVIQTDSILQLTSDDFDTLTTEYGKKHISTIVSKAFLIEHSEVIIKANAISVLANL